MKKQWDQLKEYICGKNSATLITDFESDIYLEILEKMKELESEKEK